jgi:hypothetical protein
MTNDVGIPSMVLGLSVNKLGFEIVTEEKC